ncbi:hypothetical protein EI94DRAFT_1706334 [Lactarius quietus]|nr:hypothetical protein EI94DRAFT_1706334 [Lactarius quietus]
MSSQTERGVSIFDAALACIGDRISIILLQAGDKDKNYIASLHNEVWWKIGGENMGKPFDVYDEVVVELLHAVEMLEEVQEKVITIESNAKGINEMLQTGCDSVEKVFHCLEAKEKEACHQDS